MGAGLSRLSGRIRRKRKYKGTFLDVIGSYSPKFQTNNLNPESAKTQHNLPGIVNWSVDQNYAKIRLTLGLTTKSPLKPFQPTG